VRKLIVITTLGDVPRALAAAVKKYGRFAAVVDSREAAEGELKSRAKDLVVAVLQPGKILGLDGVATCNGWLVERQGTA
jgi:hypothetical protein